MPKLSAMPPHLYIESCRICELRTTTSVALKPLNDDCCDRNRSKITFNEKVEVDAKKLSEIFFFSF